MKPPLFILLVFLLFTSLLSACRPGKSASDLDALETARHRGYFIVGVKYDSPPFGFLDKDNRLKGLEIDLAHRLAQRLIGKPTAVQFTQVNSSTRVAMLQSHQVDFILATMTINPQRARVVQFTRPYFTAEQGILVHSDSSFTKLEQMNGHKISYVIGSTTEANLKKRFPQAELLGFKSSVDAFSAFNAGRSEGFSIDDAILYGFLHEYCGLRLLPGRFSTEPYGIAVRKDPDTQPLLQAIQSELDEMMRDGTLTKLKSQWIELSPPSKCSTPSSKAR